MRVAVFGAKGRTGRLVVEKLLAGGHSVVAVSRDGAAVMGADPAQADPVTGSGVAEAVAGCDAVVGALASGRGNPACSGLARALSTLGPLRFVSIGGAAVDHPGDAKGFGDKAVGALMRVVAGPMLADRQAERDLLARSGLRWTMLRPPRLVDGEPLGRTRLTHDRPAGLSITRADLAKATVDALSDDSLIGRAAFVAS